MAAGEKVFSSRGRSVKKMTFEPVPKGVYQAKLLGGLSSKACKTDPGSVPYIKTRFELLNTAKTEGGKNKLLFHMLFLSTYPTAGGFVMIEKGGQAIDLAKACGEELQVPLLDMEANVKVGGDKDNPEYELKDIEILDPDATLQWLKDHDGVELTLNVGMRKNQRGDDENTINFFVYEETAETDGEETETADPFAEEEEAPPAKVTKIKTATKTAAKTVTKAAAGGKRR